MSFGGSVLAMIVSLKNNARKRYSKFDKWKEDKSSFNNARSTYELKSKEVSEEKLQELKNEIRRKAKKDRWYRFIISFLIILGLSMILVFYLNDKNGALDNSESTNNYHISSTQSKSEIAWIKAHPYYIDDVVQEATIAINEEKYKKARLILLPALERCGHNVHLRYALALSAVYECTRHNYECSLAQELVNEFCVKYKNTLQADQLIKVLQEEKGNENLLNFIPEVEITR